MPDAVMIVEVPSLRVVYANRFAETIGRRQLGRLPKLDLTGVPGQVLRPDGTPYERDAWPLMRAARGERVSDDRVVYVAPGGSTISLVISAAPIEDAEGRVVAAVAIGREVTEQEEADSASLREGL